MTDDGYFDEDVAATYDRLHGTTDDRDIRRTVDCLLNLADGGDILEFASGTGRIALPLAARGARVAGIELSQAMVRRMRAKETDAPLDITIGDMTQARVAGRFALVALVFNSIDNLTTQDAQVACFANAARHLQPGGRFVIETQVPPLQRLPFGETRLAFASDPDHVGIDTFDVATQGYTSRHVWPGREGQSQLAIPFRYAWPSEMDLMARLAGLTPEHRWSGWDRQPFDRFSTHHVSVWRKA